MASQKRLLRIKDSFEYSPPSLVRFKSEPSVSSLDLQFIALQKMKSDSDLPVKRDSKNKDETMNFTSPGLDIKKKKKKKNYANFLNGLIIFSSQTYNKIRYFMQLMYESEIKELCYFYAMSFSHHLNFISRQDFLKHQRGIISFTRNKRDQNSLIGYILMSIDDKEIYIYDIFMIPKYKKLNETLLVNNNTTKSKLFSKFLMEFDAFIKNQNLKPIINPQIKSKRIKQLLS